MFKKFILFTSLVLVLGLVGSRAAFSQVIDIRITSGNDDGEDHIAYGAEADDGAESRSSSDLEMPWEGGVQSSSLQTIGLRFTDIPIPKGANVVNAYVQFTGDNDDDDKLVGGPVNLIVNGLLQPNPDELGGGENFFEREPKTISEVSWTDIPEWANNEATSASRTPDISSIILEIINQDDWEQGNALMLFFRDDETNPSAATRSALSSNESSEVAPLLHIVIASEVDIPIANADDDFEQHLDDGRMDVGSSDLEFAYEDGGDPATDEQVIGLRFMDVPLDNGAPVVNAYVEVEVDSVGKQGTEAPVNLIIEGELVPDAAPFEDVANNITDRAVTAAQVKWSIPAWTEGNAKFQTPDISSIIQEIVNLEGWVSGNAIVLIFRDDKDNPSTGLREAESFDGEPEAAPTLHIIGQLSLVKIATEPSPADEATGLSSTPPLNTYTSDNVPVTIPDRWMTTTTVTSSLNVPDSITITDLNVELDFSHPTNNADLNVYLVGPDGTRVELFTDVGVWDKGFKNTILDDEAGTSIKSGSGSFTGLFRPEGNLSAFDGKNAQGTWKLEVSDDWNSGVGSLNSWRLVIESPIIISWIPADRIASQDLYISNNFDDVNDSTNAAYQGNLAADAATVEVALELGQVYFWRIDSLDEDGMLIASGDIWSFSTAAGNASLDIRIAAGTDDAEEAVNPGNQGAYNSSSDLEITDDNTDNGGRQYIGLNFRDVAITPGMNITNTYIEFVCDETKDGDADAYLLLWGNLSLNPDGFADLPTPTAISDRPRTEAKVPWEPEPWTAVGQISQTPDITSIIDEITSQEGWAPGNAIEIIIGEDTSKDAYTGSRTAESYNGSSSQAPLLHIDATTEASGSPSPADGAVDVVQSTVLIWTKGFTSVSSDVYFGKDSSPKKLETTTGNSYDVGKLDTSTTYYWRIDETDANGNKHTGAVWSFTTVIGEATNPSPADNATEVPLDVVLSWTPGATAVSHDGYFGTTDPPDFLGNTTANSFDTAEIGGLEPGTTYYWRLDAIEADGTKHIGDVWSFTTIPVTAYNPDPADGATEVATDVQLSWTAGLDAKLHAVYFGEDPDAVANADGAAPLPFTTFDPGPLEEGKTYYWRVDELNPPTTTTGEVWSFTTVEPEPEPEPEV